MKKLIIILLLISVSITAQNKGSLYVNSYNLLGKYTLNERTKQLIPYDTPAKINTKIIVNKHKGIVSFEFDDGNKILFDNLSELEYTSNSRKEEYIYFTAMSEQHDLTGFILMHSQLRVFKVGSNIAYVFQNN